MGRAASVEGIGLEVTIQLGSGEKHLELLGPADSHLKLLRRLLGIQVVARRDSLQLKGSDDQVHEAALVVEHMVRHVGRYGSLSEDQIKQFITESRTDADDVSPDAIQVFAPKRVVKPKTPGQHRYVQLMLDNDVTFCTGPAGTGKTYLAVAMAVSMLRSRKIRRLVLARPAVEAGEKLGFLPGDLQAKVNPYLRPLFDALEDMMEFAQMRKFMELDIIEIIPLAFMRGRTLNEAAIICDEAQNTSTTQMLMVLTRLGQGSKMIITGDVTQVDLAKGQTSGMVEAMDILKRVKGIGVIALHQRDIVRHRLVQNIVRAYKKHQTPRK